MSLNLGYPGSLHNHSDYSNIRLRDCINKVPDLFKTAKECGHSIVALTDHETTSGWIQAEKLKKDFRYMIKQKGGMLAKGRLLGIQFLGLLEKDLYWEIGKCADALADEIRSALVKKQIPCLVENQTNQIFPILEDKQIEKLQKDFSFSYQERVDDTHSAIRFCTSWATTKEQVKALCESILSL